MISYPIYRKEILAEKVNLILVAIVNIILVTIVNLILIREGKELKQI